MPVTAKFSKVFYDKLGDAVVNELVEWFNQVDATYRSELRALNDNNYARFEAKLEQRIAELRAEMKAGFVTLEARLDAKLSAMDAKLDTKLGAMDAKLDTKLGGLASKEYLEKRLGEQARFFFLAWAVLLASNIALWFR